MKILAFLFIVCMVMFSCTNAYNSNVKPHYYKIDYHDFQRSPSAIEKQQKISSYYFNMYVNDKNCDGRPSVGKNNLLYTPSCLVSSKLIYEEIKSIYKGDQFTVYEIEKEEFDSEYRIIT